VGADGPAAKTGLILKGDIVCEVGDTVPGHPMKVVYKQDIDKWAHIVKNGAPGTSVRFVFARYADQKRFTADIVRENVATLQNDQVPQPAAGNGEEERRAAAAAAAMDNRFQIDTFQPTNVVKGMCGKCRQPVYSSQPRRKTREGVYVHMMADGITEGCPSPPGMGTFNVPTLQNDPVPQPAAAQYDQRVNYPPPASPTDVDGLQGMSLGGSGSPEDVRPPTLAQSNFRKLYHQGGSRPDMMMHELFNDLQQFLVAHCQDIGVGRDPAIKMLKVLQREAIESVKKYGADNALDSASLARYLWTSDATLEGSNVPPEHQVEFCSILNSVIRRDRPASIKEAVRMVGMMVICLFRRGCEQRLGAA